MALGLNPARIDNDRYEGISWDGAEDIIRKAFEAKKV
jgi:hypothetical protein